MKIIPYIIFCLVFLSISSSERISAQPKLDASLSASNSELEQIAVESEKQAKDSEYQWNREALQNSAQFYFRAFENWNRLKNDSKAIGCLREIGKLKIILGQKDEAAAAYHRALKISVAAQDTINQSKVLADLSLLALSDKRVGEAKRYSARALSLAKKTFDPAAQAYALFCVAEFYYLSDSPESPDFLAQSVELWKKAGDSEGEATSLVWLGYSYIDKYEFDLAFDVLNAALSKWEAINNLRGQAFTLRAIATVLSLSNRKQEALEYYNRAEQLIPKDIDYFEQGGMYNGFGYIYENYGDWKLSIEYRKKALELFTKDNHLYGQLATIVSLCKLYRLNGNDDLALEYFRLGKAISDKLKESLYAALLEEELGNFYLSKNNSNEAESNFLAALRYFTRTKNYREISQISSKLGVLSERKNDLSRAETYFSNSLNLNRKVKDKFSETEMLFHLSKIEALKNKNAEAFNLIEDSVQQTESLYSDVINARLKQTFLSSAFDRYELYINLLMKRHRQFPASDFDVRALQTSEKSRARAMLETLSLTEANFTKDADPATVKLEKDIRNLLNAKADHLTELLSKKSDKAEIDKVNGEMNSILHQLEEVKAILKQTSPLYAEIKNPSPFDVADFQNRILDDDTVLLEFSFGEEESYLWFVGKSEFTCYVLPARREIEPHVGKLLESLSAHAPLPNESPEDYRTRIVSAEKDHRREAQILSDVLFAPIAGKIIGKRLVVVPDGKLYYFPIAALPMPFSDSDEPILTTNEVIYEPSASTLLLLAKEAETASGEKKNLLIFADPVFSNEDSRMSSNRETADNSATTLLDNFRSSQTFNSLPRLPESKAEADSIINIVGGESNLKAGFAANREAVLSAETSQYKIIHFATHGFLDEAHPELSSLLLSRYDEAGKSTDGTIRLNDIYSLKLAADLVVLSACDTGGGKEVKGEGLMSLDNAFLQVGAKSVVSSLWKVDDYATKELMENFYRELASGKPISSGEALRRAQMKMRLDPQYKSPFYWAAFTIKGNFKTAPRISGKFDSSFYQVIILAFLIFLLSVFVYFRRVGLLNRKIINNG